MNCCRVQISDSDINSADDGICLKSDPSTTGRGCEDITITNCRLRTSANGLKLGTASHHKFRRIRAYDLDVRDPFRAAVVLESVDGAVIDDVIISRVRARYTGSALFLRLGQRSPNRPPGQLRNVLLSDFDVQVPSGKPDRDYEHEGPPPKLRSNLLPAALVGLPDPPLENVTLRNFTITYGGGGQGTHAETPLAKLAALSDERDEYPEFSMFGELPAWGFFVRNGRNIRFENVTLHREQPDFRSAFVADNIDGVTLDHVSFMSGSEEPVVVLSRVQNENLRGLTWPTKTTGLRLHRQP